MTKNDSQNNDQKNSISCPFCEETIHVNSKRCKHCGNNIKGYYQRKKIKNFCLSGLSFLKANENKFIIGLLITICILTFIFYGLPKIKIYYEEEKRIKQINAEIEFDKKIIAENDFKNMASVYNNSHTSYGEKFHDEYTETTYYGDTAVSRKRGGYTSSYNDGVDVEGTVNNKLKHHYISVKIKFDFTTNPYSETGPCQTATPGNRFSGTIDVQDIPPGKAKKVYKWVDTMTDGKFVGFCLNIFGVKPQARTSYKSGNISIVKVYNIHM